MLLERWIEVVALRKNAKKVPIYWLLKNYDMKVGNKIPTIVIFIFFSEKTKPKSTHKSVTCCNSDDCNGGGRMKNSFPIVSILTFLALKIGI